MKLYSLETERYMRRFYDSLSEKDKRRYVAVESVKLGHGGKKYICELLNCNFRTLERGLLELDDDNFLGQERIRIEGGGRKRVIETTEGLDEVFLSILQDSTAGSPMDESIKWTNLTPPKITELLETKGFKVSVSVVHQLLTKHNFRKRTPFKSIAGGKNEFRNAQFLNIAEKKKEYTKEGNPVLSMDVKKKS